MARTLSVWAHHGPRIDLGPPIRLSSLSTKEARIDIPYLMRQSRICGATDPRDKVYGLYGIMAEYGVVLPAPDYRLSKEEVFWQLTAAVMRETGGLGLLALVTGSGTMPGVPSWVPDHAEGLKLGDLTFTKHVADERMEGGAAGRTEGVFDFHHDSDVGGSRERRVLSVTGAMAVDGIAMASDKTIWHPSGDVLDVQDSLLMNLEEGYEQTVRAYRDWLRIILSGGLVWKRTIVMGEQGRGRKGKTIPAEHIYMLSGRR
ncbi:hypothetical protein B0T17DRAFT_305624 [Bombardia bombarda]|uniref:Uncharacterized protein n=1 Tax=Bombardia bombarda TaxID=252184 RepID=A0AA39WUK3_9PEZI|nr:hypothetical protein B0T17DRAFT_305624 [Bombardia bombarda]